MEKQNKPITWLITGLIIGLALGGAGGYIISNNFRSANFGMRGSFQISEETKSSIVSFFDAASDMNEVTSYCNQNRMYCSYYCREINPEHEICSQIQMPANRSMRQ